MKIRTHFKHNVFMLNEAGELLEHLGGTEDYLLAAELYEVALRRFPEARIQMREGARIVYDNKLQMIASMPPDRFVGIEAAKGTYTDVRNRRLLEDNRRQIAEAERSQREREQREAAEMAKIKEADHMGRAAG